jgi:hypothetical protein
MALVRPEAVAHWTGTVRALAPHYRVYAALVGAGVLYLGARLAVAGPGFGMDMEGIKNNPAPYIESFGQHVLVVIASLALHVWSAIWPFQSVAPGRHLPLPIDITAVLPALAGSAGIVLLAVQAARTGGAGRVPGLLFLAFIASLLPVANIVPIPAVVVPVEIGVASRYVTVRVPRRAVRAAPGRNVACQAGPLPAGAAFVDCRRMGTGVRGQRARDHSVVEQ